jgi:hypothetical protein
MASFCMLLSMSNSSWTVRTSAVLPQRGHTACWVPYFHRFILPAPTTTGKAWSQAEIRLGRQHHRAAGVPWQRARPAVVII